MYMMYAIICLTTAMNCTVMYENPPRIFDTQAECDTAASIKAEETLSMLSGTEYASLEIGCEKIED
jgi:hypothetical protein|tara:strand:- start:214 stop:411 length:198 start_codon:yes stop_codon:yes gene_type:complete